MSNIKQDCGNAGCYKDCLTPCQHDEIMKDVVAEASVNSILEAQGYYLTATELRTVARQLKAAL